MAHKGQHSHSNRPTGHGHEPSEEVDVSDIRNPDTHHEEGDINVRPVYKFLGWLTVATLFVYVLVWGILKWNEHRVGTMREGSYIEKTKSDRLPPEPRLQTAPGHEVHPLAEGRSYRDSVKRVLYSYAMLDKNTGTVRVPIDVAKQMLLQKGLPVRAGTTLTSSTVDLIPEFSNGGRTYISRDQRIPGSLSLDIAQPGK